jgi:hypothetical protein
VSSRSSTAAPPRVPIPQPRGGASGEAAVFRTGYIVSPRQDLIWFLALPFFAVLIALGCQAWLPFVAVASINLWITVPHHYATWVRAYGMPDEWARFKERLIIGPVLIVMGAAAGLLWAPITLMLVVLAWDHQHTIMQQHGFGRIYDFKARTGAPATGRWDLALHWILYTHLFLNAPMFRHIWLRELYQMNIRVSVAFVEALLAVSWAVLFGFLLLYAVHVLRTVRGGQPVNPVKYAFLFSSYFLWYFTAWHTNSILLYAIAHRIMHGLQYIVMVWFFLDRQKVKGEARPGFWTRISGEGKLRWFVGTAIVYAVFYQFLIGVPLDQFGFGVVNFAHYQAIPQFDLPALGPQGGYELFSLTMLNVYGMTHYYVDSFIWKVRDAKVQSGL